MLLIIIILIISYIASKIFNNNNDLNNSLLVTSSYDNYGRYPTFKGNAIFENGTIYMWDETGEKFNDKVLKLRNYMSKNLVVLNDYPTSGSNWDKEVTADMGGLKLACLVASKKQNFDMDKFFKYYAHYFAYIATDQYIINTINGTHPIGYLRVNFILSQSEEFIDYYNIKEGDMMYTSPDNIVAIW